MNVRSQAVAMSTQAQNVANAVLRESRSAVAQYFLYFILKRLTFPLVQLFPLFLANEGLYVFPFPKQANQLIKTVTQCTCSLQ